MTTDWDADDFFEDINWKPTVDKHLESHRKDLERKKIEEKELLLEQQKAAELVLVFTFSLTKISIELTVLETEIREIITRNGGDGLMTKITIFKKNESGKKSASLAKVVIDPIPIRSSVNLICEISQKIETIFELISDEARASFVCFRVMTRREAKINF